MMPDSKFSIRDAIGFGWGIMRKNFWFFTGLFIFIGIACGVLNILINLTREQIPFLSILVRVAFWVFEIVTAMGLINLALKFCKNEKVQPVDLFARFSLFFNYLAGSALYGLIVVLGLLLLILPGIVWAIKFSFFPYYIIEKETGPLTALGKSAQITAGSKWNLFLFGLALAAINLLGGLALIIGLFATVPTTLVAHAYVYRKLSV